MRPNSFTTTDQRRRLESLDAPALARHQFDALNQLLAAMLPHNRFYAEKLGPSRQLGSLEELDQLPYTLKHELIPGEGTFATNRTFPIERYTRLHQTSGTRGRPLVVLDTPDDWRWWIECWQYVLDAAELGPQDRLMMAFSFGPFIGFWTAFEAATHRGCLVVPGGGMNSLARLELLASSGATAVFCTPTYAQHLAEVAGQHHVPLDQLPVRALVLAGEPGGSVPATRERIEQAWQAGVIDHAGATEVGAWGYPNTAGTGLHILESQFIAEFISLETGDKATEGELSELVLTSLGRIGSPVVRYRTGDLVRPTWQHSGDNRFVFLEGGVLGRSDDMMIVRGVNVFPSSVEQILRGFPDVAEFRLTATKHAEMDQLSIEVEDQRQQPDRIANEFRLRLGLRVEVRSVPAGSLPRFEGKARRFVDRR